MHGGGSPGNPDVLTWRRLRRTPQRLLVWAALARTDHPTAGRLVEALHGQVSPATVYNALNAFQRAGVVAVLECPEGRHYDVHVEPHGHLHCTRCGSLADLPEAPAGEPAWMPAAQDWHITSVTMVGEGLCPSCRRKEMA